MREFKETWGAQLNAVTEQDLLLPHGSNGGGGGHADGLARRRSSGVAETQLSGAGERWEGMQSDDNGSGIVDSASRAAAASSRAATAAAAAVISPLARAFHYGIGGAGAGGGGAADDDGYVTDEEPSPPHLPWYALPMSPPLVPRGRYVTEEELEGAMAGMSALFAQQMASPAYNMLQGPLLQLLLIQTQYASTPGATRSSHYSPLG